MNSPVAISKDANPPGTYDLGIHSKAGLVIKHAGAVDRVFHFGDVTVDLGWRKVTRRDEPVRLTRAEYNLLVLFLENEDRPLDRDVILNAAWGYDFYPKSRTVDAHMARLRRKLETIPATPRHFLTIHGVGYRFVF